MSKLKPGMVISRYPSPITQLQTWVDVLWHDGAVTPQYVEDMDRVERGTC